jgi:hypothetical protein
MRHDPIGFMTHKEERGSTIVEQSQMRYDIGALIEKAEFGPACSICD